MNLGGMLLIVLFVSLLMLCISSCLFRFVCGVDLRFVRLVCGFID